MELSFNKHYKKSALAEVFQSRQELPQTTTMKFAALALALLLAIGSQAASLQSDAPYQLEHFRSAVRPSLEQGKEVLKRILAHLDDTQYKQLKESVNQRLDNVVAQILETQAAAAPYTDAFVAQVQEATSGVRENFEREAETLKKDLEVKVENLKEILLKHATEYRERLGPAIEETRANELEALRVKMEPIVQEFRVRLAENWQETRNAMASVYNSIRSSVTKNAEALEAVVSPYLEEYKEQLRSAPATFNAERLDAIKAKLGPKFEEIKVKLGEVVALIQEEATH